MKKYNDKIIIPEMENIDEVEVYTPKNINEENKVSESTKQNDIVKEETKKVEEISNTKQLMNLIDNIIDEFGIIRNKGLQLFSYARKYKFTMPRMIGTKQLSTRNCTIMEASEIIINFMQSLRKKFDKKISKKQPFFNDQHFSELDGIIINNDNKLEFVDSVFEKIDTFREQFNEIEFFNDYYNRQIDILLTYYQRGLSKIKRTIFKKITKRKSFSYLTNRLMEID